MELFPKGKYNRRRTRLPSYDYSKPGAYFVTICTLGRLHLFGSVSQDKMLLNEAGRTAWDIWRNLPGYYYQCLEIDEFMIMPDHVHGILILNDHPADTNGEGRGPSPTIKRHALPEIVRGFKSMSSRRINYFRKAPGTPLWQRSFYEHVIRNETELEDIRQYIAENPVRWSLDSESKE